MSDKLFELRVTEELPRRAERPPKEQNQSADGAAIERPQVRPFVIQGLVVIALLLGVVVYWSWTAPIASAAIATGRVAIDTNRKSIQHLEGGIVKRIAVREGQKVNAGQTLLVLDDTKSRAKIALLSGRIVSGEQRLKLIDAEIKDIAKLFKKGLAHRPRLLALRRTRAELIGALVESRAELKAARDVINRALIRSPRNGTVVDLKVHTIGGVVAAGAILMYIVPSNEALVVEARVSPNDIDVVREGLDAQVRLTPFSARTVVPIPARVISVSADRMSDQQSGEGYYLARVRLSRPLADVAPGLKLYPGMPAEVMIVTGHRSVLQYLSAPIERSFRRAFREK